VGAAFLTEEAVAGPRLGQVVIEHLFRAFIGERHEVGRSLQRYLEVFDLAEIALRLRGGAACGLDHDVDER
jgi:hypothetical protein